MKLPRSVGATGAVLALTSALLTASLAQAQSTPPAGQGQVIGAVARCNGNLEVPAPNVNVGVDGGAANLTRTDANGQFSINLAPNQYTIVATADDGSTASREYVPVTDGQTLDIGILDLGASVTGCGPDVPASAATLAPVATPTVTPTTPPLLPTISPSPSPTDVQPDVQPDNATPDS